MEITVTEFCFNNPAGGTAISDGSFNNGVSGFSGGREPLK